MGVLAEITELEPYNCKMNITINMLKKQNCI
jgi:hypothetical protein